MGVVKPHPGTVLFDDDGEPAAIVIIRGTEVDGIRAMWWESPLTDEPLGWPRFATWRMHSARQMREQNHDCEQYWSPEGECRTWIDVAIPEGA
jgi:hypothetical protein